MSRPVDTTFTVRISEDYIDLINACRPIYFMRPDLPGDAVVVLSPTGNVIGDFKVVPRTDEF